MFITYPAVNFMALMFSVVTAFAEPPSPGGLIDRGNLRNFAVYMPEALKFAIAHGLTAKIITTTRIDWPAGFQEATEKYSGQATLDEQGHIQNYIAGMPFPLIRSSDPQAAAKIAYNWRWGPFVPDDVSITSRPRFMAWKAENESTTLRPDDDERDFRGEEPCDELTFMRYAHRTKVDPRPNIGTNPGLEWKAHGSHCGGTRDITITWSEYTSPWSINNGVKGLLSVGDIPWLLKWLIKVPDLSSQKCSYGCTMVWWDYVAPVNELYSWRLIGEQPIMASLHATGQPAGIVRVGNEAHFDEQLFEIRNAYVLEGTPVKAHLSALLGLVSSDLVSATAYIDSETYLLLGVELHSPNKSDAIFPLWSRHTIDAQAFQMELSNEFFMPGDRPDIFISLNLWPGVQKMNAGIDPSIFE